MGVFRMADDAAVMGFVGSDAGVKGDIGGHRHVLNPVVSNFS